MKINYYLKIIDVVSSFFRGIFYTYIVTIIFGLIAYIFVDTEFNKIIGFALSITPGTVTFNGEMKYIDGMNIAKFFGFWGLIMAIFENIILKITKKELVNNSIIFWFVTTLHLITFIKSMYLFGGQSALTFTLMLYVLFLFSFFFYWLTNHIYLRKMNEF
jgi:hypothetical protein